MIIDSIACYITPINGGKYLKGSQYNVLLMNKIKSKLKLLAEKYLGHKITLPAISASLDKSDRLDHIKNTRAFIVETTNQKIPNGRIAVVVPNDYVPSFAKSFLTRTEIEPRNLSGYLYKCRTRNSSFLYLHCSHTPMEVTRRKSSAPDPLHELVSTYLDLDDNGRDQLIDLARKLNPPE